MGLADTTLGCTVELAIGLAVSKLGCCTVEIATSLDDATTCCCILELVKIPGA